MKYNRFHEWLRSQSGYVFLKRCNLLNLSDDSTDEKTFWDFLISRGGKSQVVLQDLVEREDWEGLRRKLSILHSSFIAEQGRDPLYQRVRQVLQGADKSYGYQPGRKFSWYGSIASDAEEMHSFKELLANDFAPTYPTVKTEAIKTEACILVLAASFRAQILAHCGIDYRIPLQALCDYVRHGYDVSLVYEKTGEKKDRKTQFSSGADATADDETSRANNENARLLPNTASFFFASHVLRSSTNQLYNEEALARFAGVVASQLEREQLLLVLCLRVYCDLTMAQTAKILGYAGPSGVNVPFKRAQALIKEACSLHEGLGGDDLDEEMFVHFTGLLLESCKDDDCSRDTWEKR